jgi:hypothetical protein
MSGIGPEITTRALMPRDLLNQASSLHFAVHIGGNRVEATLADAASTEILWSEIFEMGNSAHAFTESIDFISSCNWSERVFRKSTLSFDSTAFTLVPGAFFEADKMQEVLLFNTGMTPENPGHILLNEAGAQIIFDRPSKLDEVTSKFPNLRIFPSAWVFGKYAAQNSDKNNSHIHLYVNGNYLLLAAYKSQRLMMLNRFEVNSSEDLLYYTANAAIRLDIDLENCYIRLFDYRTGAQNVELLKNYCKNAEFKVSPKVNHKSENSSVITQLHLICA